ncbi:MAG: 30S ribosomal protein S16 [Parachlamydiales bacterium]|jgi:small subunit ribosomal protein S16
MALIIRLRQQGRDNRQTFRLVVTDVRNPRDGKYLENLGWYDPEASAEKGFVVQAERVKHWVALGAQVSQRALQLMAKAAPEIVGILKARKAKKNARKRTQKKK